MSSTDGVESTSTGINDNKNVDSNASTPSAFSPTASVGECKHPSHILREYDFNDPNVVLCLMLVFFGLVYCFLGYRCFRGTMFLTGFVFGSVIVYSVCVDEAVCPAYAKIGLSLGIGIIVGLLTMLVHYVGLFLVGFHTGILTCFASVAIANYLSYRITSVWLSIGYLLTSGIVFALAALHWKKGLTIFGTSVYGAAVLTGTLDYFMEKLVMLKWIWEKLTLKNTVQPCEMSHYILITWPVFVFIGIAVQWALTGKGIHHIKGFEKQSRHNSHNQRTRNRGRDLNAENSQKKYRYLYQVRTAHGDVISQNYVQALQRKVMPPDMMTTVGESSTLQSDATHLTTLPVDQTMTQLSDSKTNTVDSGGSVRYDINRYQDLSSRESVQSNIANQYYQ